MSLDLKKGSYNRLWAVLAALAYKDGEATLKELSDLSGLPRSSTEDILKKVLDGQVPAMKINRNNATFTIVEWGYFLNKEHLVEFFTKHLNNG
ncbi:helix-turn-helix domain-containing protein [Vibrio splendidus]|uniref:helix-turn-helix domain-containing protein n=1 Tax=Vibrio splendidus TaxID=29497 RepID=UPI00352EF252